MMKLNGVPFVSLGLSALVGAAISSLFIFAGKSGGIVTPPPSAKTAAQPAQCDYTTARIAGFQRTKPLLSSEPVCQAPRFEGLRASIGTLVDDLKASGKVASASVYVRDFQKGEWTCYNGDEPYDPASMLKIPLMLTYLSMTEEDPAVLGRTWTCEQVDFDAPQHSAFPAEQVQGNVSYTVAQLLEYMMVRSDNRATVMLLRHVPKGRYIKTFTDLGLPPPDWESNTYRMNLRDYSVFMKALYNSSFLSPVHSEYAMELMSRAVFKQGLVAGIPGDVEVAHKFGEAGDSNERQLHETGLVYASGNPYLITVMTRGANPDSLASVISSLSRLVYQHMTSS